MKKSFLNRINSVRARRMVSLVLALAFCLSFGGWFVIEGDDAPAVPVCGITEHVHDLSCCETVCGVPETPAHTHGPECYESVLICTDESPEHVHGDGCYQSVLTCALPEGEGHIHDESCYKKVLICEDVSPEHIHDELCYEYSYICGMEEHVHTDECYVLQDETQQDDQDSQDGEIVDGQPLPDVPVQNDPAAVTYCGMIEHTHTPECYDITGALICGMPEHQHYDTCYIDPTAMTYCGMVEHTHTPECYDIAGALVCGLEQHTHTVDCYVQTVYYCGKEEHSHTATCYNEMGELICGLEEHWHTPECLQPIVYYCGKAEHQHTDACYSVEGILTCLIEEHTHSAECLTPPAPVYYCGKAEHQHTDACYSVEGILTCLIEEHTHSAECLMPPAPVYYCGKEEHVHTDACYSIEGILTCTIEEHLHTVECEMMPEPQADVIETYCGLTEHTHTDDCYAWNCDLQLTDPTHVHSTATCAYSLICMLPEHVHDWKCYISPDAPIICGKEEHTHSDACGYWSCTELMAHEHRPEYGCTWVPVCLKEEHTHGPECYGAPGSAGYGCGLEEHTHGPECYETVYLCGNTDPAHVHDETCPSELRLICTKPEHTHDFMCEVMGDTVKLDDLQEDTLYIETAPGVYQSTTQYTEANPFILGAGRKVKVVVRNGNKHINVDHNNYNEDGTENESSGTQHVIAGVERQYDNYFNNEYGIWYREFTPDKIIGKCRVFLDGGSEFWVQTRDNNTDQIYIVENGNLRDINTATNEKTGKSVDNGDLYRWGGRVFNSYPLEVGQKLTLKLFYSGNATNKVSLYYGDEIPDLLKEGVDNTNCKEMKYGDESKNIVSIVESTLNQSENSITVEIEGKQPGVGRVVIDDSNGNNPDISIRVIRPASAYPGVNEDNKIYYENRSGQYVLASETTPYKISPGEEVKLAIKVGLEYALSYNAGGYWIKEDFAKSVEVKSSYWDGQYFVAIIEPKVNSGQFKVSATVGTYGSVGEGKQNGIDYILPEAVSFEVVDHSIFVEKMTLGTKTYEDIPIDRATKMVTDIDYFNSEETPYILYVGDVLTVYSNDINNSFHVGDNGSDDQKHLERTPAHDGYNYKEDGKVKAQFVGLNPTSNDSNEPCCIVLYKNEGGEEIDRFYIQVKEPIDVQSGIGELHKDTIHEALDDLHSYNSNFESFITDDNGSRIYIKNGEYAGDGNPYGARYVVTDGDELTLVAYTMESGKQFQVNDTTHIKQGEGKEESVTGKVKEGRCYYRVEQKFKFTNSNSKLDPNDKFKNKVNAEIKFGNETFYLVIQPNIEVDNVMNLDMLQRDNHFDIEISDGGKYILTKTSQENGKTVIERITYDAYVYGVNGCTVWKNYKLNLDTGDLTEDSELIARLTADEYWMNADLGSTQFEYTSAYEVKISSDGQKSKGGFKDRPIDHADVGNVVFDLKLALKPVKYEKQIDSGEFETLADEKSDYSVFAKYLGNYDYTSIDGGKYYIRESVPVVMGEQEIIDACNKCPNHSGLDFTLKNVIYGTEVIPAAKKQYLQGGTDVIKDYVKNDKTFEFRVYNQNPLTTKAEELILLGTRKTNNDGVIQLSTVSFVNPGTYFYYVQEVTHDGDGITYDPRVLRIKIVVRQHSTTEVFKGEKDPDDLLYVDYVQYQFLKADPGGGMKYIGDGDYIVKAIGMTAKRVAYAYDLNVLEESAPPTFINHAPFELPVTGGGGAGPPRAVGAGLIITGFILMPKGRRRERSGCLRDAARAGDKK